MSKPLKERLAATIKAAWYAASTNVSDEAAADAVLELMAKEGILVDSPEADATDFAHPAWWRGNDAGVAAAVTKLVACLEGEDDGKGVVAYAPMEALRRRLLAMGGTRTVSSSKGMGYLDKMVWDLADKGVYKDDKDDFFCPWCNVSRCQNKREHKLDCAAMMLLNSLTKPSGGV